MVLGFRLLCFLFAALSLAGAEPSASALAASIHQIALDPNGTYRVRDIHWVRGDVSFYLNEGVLSFAAPVGGRTIAAVFTTQGVETGDAEVVVSPHGTGERASLAYFTKTPNLDEHFNQALFLFTDATYNEILKQMEAGAIRKAPETVATLVSEWQGPLREIAGDIDVPIVSSILSGDPPALGVFDAVLVGLTLGQFDVIYDPHQVEATTLGHVAMVDGAPRFQVWTSFAPRRRAMQPPEDPFLIDEYRIDATIRPDLQVSAVTRFRIAPRSLKDCVLDLQLSQLIKVTSASVDGQPAEVLQHQSVRAADENDAARFLVMVPTAKTVDVEIHFQGRFVKDEGGGTYFVQARNIWFPYDPLQPAKLDLTFHCPENLQIVSSGSLISETVQGGVRTVHRRLNTPVRIAGFNLGEFARSEREAPPFHLECYANRSLLDRMNEDPTAKKSEQPLERLCSQAAETLDTYSKQWGTLPFRNIAVTPIPGTFGQGFPGLIYLSTLSYLPPGQRPPPIRNSILNLFFSDLLLPHELAHQWWGNLLVPQDYRSDWIVEALANYAAFQLYQQRHGSAAFDRLMLYYFSELTELGPDRKTIESTGPVDLGTRLKTAIGENSWRIITYDKGTWVIHMLCRRLGERAFASFLRYLAAEYAGKTLSNEQFRLAAARFLPKSDPDPSLELFFDSWVYGTGIPKLTLTHGNAAGEYTLRQSGVPDNFSVDVPITVNTGGSSPLVKWVRSNSDGAVFRVRSSPGTVASLPPPGDFLRLGD